MYRVVCLGLLLAVLAAGCGKSEPSQPAANNLFDKSGDAKAKQGVKVE